MKYRRMGQTGLRLSSVSIGGWLTFGGSIDDAATGAIVRAAIEGGVNFIDLADVYSKGEAERAVGAVLGDFRRSDLVISSKVFGRMGDGPNDRGLCRKHVMEAVEGSLERLGTDYLDLYFCHRADPDTPLEETVRAMDDLVHRGKVHYWGTSMWPAETLEAAHDLCDRRGYYPPLVEQPEFSLLERRIEKELLPTTKRLGMGVVVWSPLAGGLLTGKYDDGLPEGSRGAQTEWLDEKLTDATRAKLVRHTQLARQHGLEPSQLALAWVLANPSITSVITGATRPEQVEMNLQAAEVELAPGVVESLDALFAS